MSMLSSVPPANSMAQASGSGEGRDTREGSVAAQNGDNQSSAWTRLFHTLLKPIKTAKASDAGPVTTFAGPGSHARSKFAAVPPSLNAPVLFAVPGAGATPLVTVPSETPTTAVPVATIPATSQAAAPLAPSEATKTGAMSSAFMPPAMNASANTSAAGPSPTAQSPIASTAKRQSIAAVPETSTQTASTDPVLGALTQAATKAAAPSGLEPAKPITIGTATLSGITRLAAGTATATTNTATTSIGPTEPKAAVAALPPASSVPKVQLIAALPEAVTQPASTDPVLVALMAAATKAIAPSGLEPTKISPAKTNAAATSDIAVDNGTIDSVVTNPTGAAITGATTTTNSAGVTTAGIAAASNLGSVSLNGSGAATTTPAAVNTGAASIQAAAGTQPKASAQNQSLGHAPAQTTEKASGQTRQTDPNAAPTQTAVPPPTADASTNSAPIIGAVAAAPVPITNTPVSAGQNTSLRTASLTERIQVVNQVAQQIQALHGANAPQARTVTMQLHPDQWGPVTISVTAHGADAQGRALVSAVVMTGHADAQALLSRHGQDLKDALSSAGLRLDKLDVQTATVAAASGGRSADGHQQGQRESQGTWSAPQGGMSAQTGSQGGQGFASAFEQSRSQQRQAPADGTSLTSLPEHAAPLSAVSIRAGGLDLHA